VRSHHAMGAVRWQLVGVMAPGLMIGALAGSYVADLLGSAWLMRLFGIFAALIGLRMLFGQGRADVVPVAERRVPHVVHAGVAGSIGVASAIFGIGGGSLVVPYLNGIGIRMQQAVATSSACGVPIAIAGAGGFMLTGWQQPGLPAGSAGYVYLPGLAALVLASMPMAGIGARLAHRLPAATLRRLFALILMVVAADFLLK